MALLLITSDLLIQSRVAAATERAAVPLPKVCTWQEVGTLEKPLAFRLIILDLTTPGLEVAEAVGFLRKFQAQPTPILAFGPHVHAGRLAAARNAGCDHVLSRGQVDRDLDNIIAHFAKPGQTDEPGNS